MCDCCKEDVSRDTLDEAYGKLGTGESKRRVTLGDHDRFKAQYGTNIPVECNVKDVSPLESQTMELQRCLNNLEKSLHVLNEKLTPVLSSGPDPAPEQSEDELRNCSEHVQTLIRMTDQVLRIENHVTSLTRRAET